MKRHALLLGLFVLVASALHEPAGLGFGASVFPAVILLPVGFGPEGIAAGIGTTFYVDLATSGDSREFPCIPRLARRIFQLPRPLQI
jgi:hypothetical protein